MRGRPARVLIGDSGRRLSARRRRVTDRRNAFRPTHFGTPLMTFDERVRALEPLRLTERQARFVVTVALHSGYCLRRQYMAFAGLRYGRVVRHFLDHLVTRQLAVRERCRADRGYLYHLQARAIYRLSLIHISQPPRPY